MWTVSSSNRGTLQIYKGFRLVVSEYLGVLWSLDPWFYAELFVLRVFLGKSRGNIEVVVPVRLYLKQEVRSCSEKQVTWSRTIQNGDGALAVGFWLARGLSCSVWFSFGRSSGFVAPEYWPHASRTDWHYLSCFWVCCFAFRKIHILGD